MIASSQHHEGIAGIELGIESQFFGGREAVVPKVGTGNEARYAVLTGTPLAGKEDGDTSVSTDAVRYRCRAAIVVNKVVAVKDLSSSSGVDAEDDGIIQLWRRNGAFMIGTDLVRQ